MDKTLLFHLSVVCLFRLDNIKHIISGISMAFQACQQVVLSHLLRKLWSFGICCTISLFDVHICIDLFSVNCYDTK